MVGLVYSLPKCPECEDSLPFFPDSRAAYRDDGRRVCEKCAGLKWKEQEHRRRDAEYVAKQAEREAARQAGGLLCRRCGSTWSAVLLGTGVILLFRLVTFSTYQLLLYVAMAAAAFLLNVVLCQANHMRPERREPKEERSRAEQEMRPTKFCRKCGVKIPRDSEFCEECGTELGPTPSSESEMVQERASKPSGRHGKTVVAGLVVVGLLIGSVFMYWSVCRPMLQFDGSEAVNLVAYGDHTGGSVKLVINGNGRLLVESIKLDMVGVTLQIVGSYPTTVDLPAHFAVYVGSGNPNTGSRLTINLAGIWLLLGSSTWVDLHAETDLMWWPRSGLPTYMVPEKSCLSDGSGIAESTEASGSGV